MNLLVDIGNSRLKSAFSPPGTVKIEPFTPFAWRDTSRPSAAVVDEFGQLLDDLWSSITPERIIVCNVAGEVVLAALSAWCGKKGWPDFELCESGESFDGLINGYANPLQLGSDRWAAMIGARAENKGALCIIDSGTATTVDLVDQRGQHLGGAIFPGVNTMRRALNTYTAGLFDSSGNIQPFANATKQGIAGGTGYASAGAIDRFVDEALLELTPLTVIFTGGEASLVAPLLRNTVVVDELLVLKGLDTYAGRQI